MENTKEKEEIEDLEYIIDINVRLIHRGDKVPDKGFVINPIEDFINKRLEKFKNNYRLKRININVEEAEEIVEELEEEEF